ncbi:MAG TPA: hypothetical protein VGC61_03490, partial [Pyrinomonadaceae bacterium]
GLLRLDSFKTCTCDIPSLADGLILSLIGSFTYAFGAGSYAIYVLSFPPFLPCVPFASYRRRAR